MRYLSAAVKVALSLALVLLFVPRIGAQRFFELLQQPSTLLAIATAVGALLIQSLLAAARQVRLISLLDHRIGFFYSLKVWFSGLIVSQLFVTFIAGDVVRAYQFARASIPRRVAGRAVVLDRLVGFVVLLAMILVVSPEIFYLVTDATLRLGFSMLCLAAIVTICLFFSVNLISRALQLLPWDIKHFRLVEIAIDLALVSRFLLRARRQSIEIAVLSVVMHLLNVLAILAIARSLGVTASPWIFSAIVIPVLFLSMLPISFAGWGVREAAMVTGLGLIDVPSDIALTISVSFGLSAILASLPGLPTLLFQSRKADKLAASVANASKTPRPDISERFVRASQD